ncbi:hypothetical protein [Miltoncostaea oceani]|uniref:hypothetical protein n=1 Tax=Miltoncostaea oceani TaxID=2843216 RepID=UPI001C3E5470|nr:hypothetical protein [Miltoncostaea oceani]
MNARAIDRRLRAGTRRTFFGTRSFATIRIPLDAIPEPFPALEAVGTPSDLSLGRGFIKSVEGGQVLTTIDSVSGQQPTADPGIQNVTKRAGSDWSEWHEVRRQFLPADGGEAVLLRVDAVEAKATSDAVLALEDWEDRWVHGRAAWEIYEDEDPRELSHLLDRNGDPWYRTHPRALARLWDAATHAKTTYYEITEVAGEPCLELTFSVKVRLQQRRMRFSASLRRALDTARRDGFPARLT